MGNFQASLFDCSSLWRVLFQNGIGVVDVSVNFTRNFQRAQPFKTAAFTANPHMTHRVRRAFGQAGRNHLALRPKCAVPQQTVAASDEFIDRFIDDREAGKINKTFAIRFEPESNDFAASRRTAGIWRRFFGFQFQRANADSRNLNRKSRMTNPAIFFQRRQQRKFFSQQIFNRAGANQSQRFLLAQ